MKGTPQIVVFLPMEKKTGGTPNEEPPSRHDLEQLFFLGDEGEADEALLQTLRAEQQRRGARSAGQPDGQPASGGIAGVPDLWWLVSRVPFRFLVVPNIGLEGSFVCFSSMPTTRCTLFSAWPVEISVVMRRCGFISMVGAPKEAAQFNSVLWVPSCRATA